MRDDEEDDSRPFSLGVTGHRPHKLNAARLDVIAGDIGRVMDAIAARFEPRPLFCVTALAEGADTMAAEAALARHWKLKSPIPFPAGHYARDFAKGPPLETFKRLMNVASVVACTDSRLELADETDGYVAASVAMLEMSDAVIAVWDGAPTELRGGAYDTMMLALAVSQPVLWIDAKGEAPPLYLERRHIKALQGGRRPAAAGEDAFLAALA